MSARGRVADEKLEMTRYLPYHYSTAAGRSCEPFQAYRLLSNSECTARVTDDMHRPALSGHYFKYVTRNDH